MWQKMLTDDVTISWEWPAPERGRPPLIVAYLIEHRYIDCLVSTEPISITT